MSQGKDKFNGVLKNQEIDPGSMSRDHRTAKQKFSDKMGEPDFFMMMMGITISALVFAPGLGEIWFLIGIWLIRFTAKKEFRLPFRMPKSSGLLDPGQPDFKDKPSPAEGITFFGNERNTQNELWFNNSDMRTHVLVFGSTGAGKALRKKELVHTPTGWKKNEDLKVGDLVSTPFGLSSIVGVYPQGELELYKITFEDGRVIEVSGDHLWEIHHKEWNKKEIAEGVLARAKVMNTESLLQELSKNKVNQNYYVILSNEVEKPEVDLPIHPYVLGALLGDGSINNRNIRFSTSDDFIINKLNQLMPDDCVFNKLKSNKKYDYNLQFTAEYKNSGKLPNGEYVKKSIFKNLQKLDLIGLYSYNKFIPSIYKNSSIEQRYQILQGLMDTDGSAYKGRVDFSTSSKELAQDVCEIINSLGGIAKIKERQTSYTYKNEKKLGKISYRVYIRISEPHKLFSLKRKMEQVQTYQYKDTLKLKVLSVEKTNRKEDCQCIKIADKRGLFITKDYIVTHNTETLLSLAYNALVQGSGLIYVDGKGENVLYTKVFAMARTMGREDDVLCINYMTGSRDVFGPQKTKLSNTLNPFSSGGSGGLTELVVSLMDDGGGGGDMWKGRAISLISAMMMALTYMRDQKDILLDVDIIREYLILDNIIKLYKQRKDFPNHIRAALKGYLVSLPGFQENAPKQNDTVAEQHGYLQMQFTKILGSLADQYGFIFKTNLGEVDFKDVVLNRRILVVLLPALEKSTEELSNLGKIIVACLKQMMAAALGSSVEGTYAEVVETKPTNSDMPFMTVLDEYGYYAVKGSAVMPAQARSLGFSMIFAGQDLPAFEKASKEEAASIVANCNIKICMKLEDPQSTFDLFDKSASEALVSDVSNLEMQSGGLTTTFKPASSASVRSKKRLDVKDLKEQKEGQGHILFKSAVVRAQMFYASPPKPPLSTMNYFVRVEPPDIEVINQMDNGLKSLIKNIGNEHKIKELEENLEIDSQNIDKMRLLLDAHSSLKMSEAAFATIASLGNEIFNSYDEKIGNFKNSLDNTEDDDDEIQIFSSTKERQKYLKERYNVSTDDDDDDSDDDDDVNVFLDEKETRSGFENIERMMGSSDEQSRADSNRTIEDMKKLSSYPKEGKPSNKDPEEIMDLLNELDEMFEKDDD